MSGYGSFAELYDRFNGDVDYELRAEYAMSLFRRFDRVPTLVLDVACGTGDLTMALSRHGIEMIGIDRSPQMLSKAKEKDTEDSVLWLCQDATRLDLFGTINGAVCTMDSVNHFTDPKTLQEMFRRVSLFLEEGSLFLFDVNTAYKHKTVLGDQTFVLEDETAFLVWQNAWDEESAMTCITIDAFLRRGDGYDRMQEEIWERYYSPKELETLAHEAGFAVLDRYGDLTQCAPSVTEERAVYVLQKIGKTGTVEPIK